VVEDWKYHEKVYPSTGLFCTNLHGPESSVADLFIEEKHRYRKKWFPASHHRFGAAWKYSVCLLTKQVIEEFSVCNKKSFVICY
jgi:hypothetical protein